MTSDKRDARRDVTLTIAADLKLPLETVTQKLAFLGRTGTGKTYAAMKLAEEMLSAGAQIGVLDAVGKWYGLRVPGAGAAFEIPVFGGLHGDYPLEATGGKLLADVLVDRAISAVLDVSQFIKSEQTRFALDFSTHFYQRKKAAPSAVHLFLEECQEFVPQNAMPGEQAMLSAFERLWKLGRNFGIGGSLISQRPQEINKKALNQTGTLFVFGMTGPQERKAIESWVSAQGIDEDIADVLPKLSVGQPHVWSPEFLSISRTVKIAEKRTADVSATPDVLKATKERPLTPIDAAHLAEEMKATVERAKQDDPRELKKLLATARADRAKLTRELDAVKATPAQSATKARQTFTAADRAVLERLATALEGLKVRDILAKVARVEAQPVRPMPRVNHATIHVARITRQPTRKVDAGDGLSQTQRRILNMIATLVVRGLTPNREMVARWLGIHPNGGRYNRDLAALRSAGLLDSFTLTVAGEPEETGFDATLRAVSSTQRKILETLETATRHGRALSREELAAELGIHPNGGRFNRDLAWLRTMGVIPERGVMHITNEAQS